MMKCTHDNCFTCPYDDCIKPSASLSKKDRSEIRNRDKRMFAPIGKLPVGRTRRRARINKTNRNYNSN